MIPQPIRQSVQVSHLSKGSKQTYTPGRTITAGVVPMDVKQHALEGGVYTDPALLYFYPHEDVRVSDKLTIKGETYFVKKIFDASFCGHPFKRASISKE
jgi:hypothetical protein